MPDFFEALKSFGPFTAPLCLAMGWAIKWLISDRARLQEQLNAAHEDAKTIRDKRTEDQRATATELRQYSEAMAHRMEAWSDRADKVLDKERG